MFSSHKDMTPSGGGECNGGKLEWALFHLVLALQTPY